MPSSCRPRTRSGRRRPPGGSRSPVEAALLTLVGVVFMQLEGFKRLPPGIEQLELQGENAAGPLQTAHLKFADQTTAVKTGGMAIPRAAAMDHAAAKRPT